MCVFNCSINQNALSGVIFVIDSMCCYPVIVIGDPYYHTPSNITINSNNLDITIENPDFNGIKLFYGQPDIIPLAPNHSIRLKINDVNQAEDLYPVIFKITENTAMSLTPVIIIEKRKLGKY